MINMGEVIVNGPMLRKNLFWFLKMRPGYPGNHLERLLVKNGFGRRKVVTYRMMWGQVSNRDMG
jgi:hypothetical protein